MRLKFNIKQELKLSVALITLFILIGFSERQNQDVVCKNIAVKIFNTFDNHFIDEADVLYLLQDEGGPLIGASLSGISLRSLERKLKSERVIGKADVFSDLKGNLVVHVTLRRPIARVIRQDGPDAYITEDGFMMPVSDKFTSRVLLLSGPFTQGMFKHDNLYNYDEGAALMEVLHYINEREFWRAQVAQLDIDRKGDITILPQITRQRVEFGKPENIEHKFKKLMVFYKEILPKKGWNAYDKVNLKYQDQIIAE